MRKHGIRIYDVSNANSTSSYLMRFMQYFLTSLKQRSCWDIRTGLGNKTDQLYIHLRDWVEYNNKHNNTTNNDNNTMLIIDVFCCVKDLVHE